jgi:hypothetical protein
MNEAASKFSLVTAIAIVAGSVVLPYTPDFSGQFVLTEHAASAKGGGSGGNGGGGNPGAGNPGNDSSVGNAGENPDGQGGWGGGSKGRSDGDGQSNDDDNSEGEDKATGATAGDNRMSIGEAVDNFERDLDAAIDAIFGSDDGQSAQ